MTVRQTKILLTALVCATANLCIADESRLIDIGDQILEVQIQGSGDKTVVLESGLGHDLSVWADVAVVVSQSANVVSYSRAGYGKSAASDRPRTLEQIAGELRALLLAAKIDGPVILVGHSAGGFYIRKFAELYPELVEGYVFVDATPEKIFVELRVIDRERALEEETVLASMTPDRVKPEDEYFSAITKSGVYPASGDLPDVPTAVITAMKQEYPQFLLHSVEGKQAWLKLQAEFADQFSDRLHIVSTASGHNVHREQPELVVNAIQYVLRQVDIPAETP